MTFFLCFIFFNNDSLIFFPSIFECSVHIPDETCLTYLDATVFFSFFLFFLSQELYLEVSSKMDLYR